MEELFNALIIGDPHIKGNNIKYTEPFISQTVNIARERSKDGLNFIIILGDTLDGHEKIDMRSMNRATKFILELSRITETYVLIGNHDRANNQEYLTSDHPFYGLEIVGAPEKNPDMTYKERKYKVNIVRRPTAIRINNQRILLCPYVPPGKFDESLETIAIRKNDKVGQFNVKEDMNKIKVIFAHQEFKGCNIGNMKSSIGDHWPKDRPLVISGHIHENHSPQENIIYPGTPYQTSYNDKGEKGIFMFRFYEKGHKIEHIPLNIPQRITISVKPGETPQLREGERYIVDENVDKQWLEEAKKNNKIIMKRERRDVGKNIKSYDDIVRELIKDDQLAVNIFNEL